jgi:hypothetical protein
MPDRTRTAMTPSQREHLGLLLKVGALTRETAVCSFDHRPTLHHLNPGVIGILIDKGFADKRVRGARGESRITVYWLTAAGQAKARELAAAQGAGAP